MASFVRTIAALLLAAAASVLAAAPPPDPVARLEAYLRIDTSNPPGNEKAAALYLKSILDAAGIASELDEPAPGRASLYARLLGTEDGGALLLHHHMDVVPADPAGWRTPPFAAARDGSRITARGALDDKALGIAELEAFLALAKRPLKRDVVYLATADEEAGGALGVASIEKRRPGWLAGVAFAIGEGGETETVLEAQRVFGIELAQKSALWLRLEAAGEREHSASVGPSAATSRLARVLGALASMQGPVVVSPLVDETFRALAPVKPPALRTALSSAAARAATDPGALRGALTPRFLALVTDTLAITRLGPEAGPPNSVPATAFAELDCRLLPSTDARAFLAELTRRAAVEHVQVKVLLDAPGGPASPKGELYETIAAVLKSRYPGTIVAPSMTPGTSENRVFRTRGIAAYGLTPFRVSVYDQAGIHGVNERIRADWFLDGVEAVKEIVSRFVTGSAK